MSKMDIGFNFVEDALIREGSLEKFDKQMSIVRFLQGLSRNESIPSDVTVLGLESLLHSAEDPDQVSNLMRGILIESVNQLIMANPIVQFVVRGDLQTWEHPIISYKGEKLPLRPIFGGSLKQIGVHHYHAEINVLS